MSAIGLHRLGLIVAAFVPQTALLRAGLPGPDEAQARPSLVGQLLVAAPGVGDPRFERTVILIVEQGPDGTLGIVVNKPIGDQPLASVFQALGQKDGDATESTATLRAACASSATGEGQRRFSSPSAAWTLDQLDDEPGPRCDPGIDRAPTRADADVMTPVSVRSHDDWRSRLACHVGAKSVISTRSQGVDPGV